MKHALLALALWLPSGAQMNTSPHVSPMAGRWFAGDAAGLTKQLAQANDAARKRQGMAAPRKQLAGLIVPHAGIEFSGVVAAEAWRLAAAGAQSRTIILLAFSHKGGVKGVVSPHVSGFKTPLGTLAVNRNVVGELGFPLADETALCDHSLENQLPFLHGLVGAAGFVPLYVGEMSAAERQAAARKLAARAAAGDLIVASTDFTHHGKSYGYEPFGEGKELPEKLHERAQESFEHVGSLDVALFERFLRSTGDTMCGVDPVRLLMAAMRALETRRGGVYMSTVDYLNSGDLTRDWSTAVSYGALAFYPASAYTVGERDRAALLQHARATLDDAHPGGLAAKSVEFEQRTGVFVTIKKQGELRGCIGTLSPRADVWSTVADRTLAAARSDPRFPPLTSAEGPVTLEVSLMTPLKLLGDWHAWKPGMGGVLTMDDHGGLFLPQVAAENKWGREEFLENLSLKAGLQREAYRKPAARLYVFEAQVFGEPAQ
ncbi:MAG: AmmeMemoRadiSam system protein B [Acidobacteriota bacterium]